MDTLNTQQKIKRLTTQEMYVTSTVLLFITFDYLYFGYFDPENMFILMRANDFPGDETNIPTKK